MLSGNVLRQPRINLNRYGASLITAKRIVVDELCSCHAKAMAQILNVDVNGVLLGQEGATTCYTSLASALGDVSEQLGGTVIKMAPGTYTLPNVDLPVNNLKFTGDTCPVAGISYVHEARRNCLADVFIPDNILNIQGCGLTDLSISGQVITVEMGGGNSDPDFSQCASLVGHQIKILAIPGGAGSGVITTHNITAATANSITIDGIMPLSNPPEPGEGFVIMPNVILSATDGTQVKNVKNLEFEGVIFDVSSALFINADEQNYLNNVIDTGATLHVQGKGITGTGNTVLGHLVTGQGSQQQWTWGGILGAMADVVANANVLTWQFGAAGGATSPFRARNAAQTSTFGSDWFNCTTGPSAIAGSSIDIANNLADNCGSGYFADTNSTVSSQGIPWLTTFSTVPASAVDCTIGFEATFNSHIYNPGTSSLPVAALDLPAISGNSDDIDLDSGNTFSFPIGGSGHRYGEIAPAVGASGFSHAFGLA